MLHNPHVTGNIYSDESYDLMLLPGSEYVLD